MSAFPDKGLFAATGMTDKNRQLVPELRRWWRAQRSEAGVLSSSRSLVKLAWEFLFGSLPSQRRQRYGDIDYDWEQRVDTTSATVSWRSRLLGLLNSPYQPIPPEQFREMMAALEIDFREFTFIDIGSGKGRALLLAAEYGFRQIIGVELLPELHRVAEQNIGRLRGNGEKTPFSLICSDAAEFALPPDPTVLFLFNPLPLHALNRLVVNIEMSLDAARRPFFVAYANPVLGSVFSRSSWLERTVDNPQFSIFRSIT